MLVLTAYSFILHIALISKSSFSDQGTKPALYRKTDTMAVTMLVLKAYSFMEAVKITSDDRESICRLWGWGASLSPAMV